MALRIIRSEDPITVSQVVLTIVGAGGVGKTTLAFTAEAPLLFDFDGGAYRAGNRRDSVPVAQWEDAANVSREDLAPYKSAVVDTAGRALDKLTEFIGRTQPKLARSSGALSLQGYGELKAVFVGWVKRLRETGLDVILLAHDAEEKDGDDVKIRPDIQGGSRQEIVKAADAMGYLHWARGRRILDFNPSDRWMAKNCAGLDPLVVPDFKTDPAFLAGVIARIKADLNARSEAQRVAAAESQKVLDWIAAAGGPADYNAILADLRAQPGMMEAMRSSLWAATKAAGLTYDKKSEAFVAAS